MLSPHATYASATPPRFDRERLARLARLLSGAAGALVAARRPARGARALPGVEVHA